METTKSSVEIPSPVTGVVARFGGVAGDVVAVGDLLIEFTVADGQAGIVGVVPSAKPAGRRIRLSRPDE